MATQREGGGYGTQNSGRNCPLHVHNHPAPTPTAVTVNVEHHASATSSLTSSAAAAATIAPNALDYLAFFDDNDDASVDAPSPKKDLTDFSKRKTDDDLVASGDYSVDWEKEDLSQQAEADALDDISEGDGPVNEVDVFVLIAREEEEEQEVRNDNPPPWSLRLFEYH
jgi:hypothetical protein